MAISHRRRRPDGHEESLSSGQAQRRSSRIAEKKQAADTDTPSTRHLAEQKQEAGSRTASKRAVIAKKQRAAKGSSSTRFPVSGKKKEVGTRSASKRKFGDEKQRPARGVGSKRRAVVVQEPPMQSAQQLARHQRALSQRLFLIGRRDSEEDLANDNMQYVVLGTTGNVYYPTFSSDQTKCTCIDQRCRKRFCKHLLFILLKVLKMPKTHPIFQREMAVVTSDELGDIYNRSKLKVTDVGAVAPESVRRAWASAAGQTIGVVRDAKTGEVKQRVVSDGDTCPICFDELANGEPLTYCRSSCGNSMHDECWSRWADAKRKAGESATCVYCRQPWWDAGSDRSIKRFIVNLEGYVDDAFSNSSSS